MPLSFFRDSVTVQRGTLTSKNGMEYYDFSNPATITVSRVQVTAQSTSQDFERTLNVTDRRTLRAAYDADIQTGDRVVWNGETYEVEGEVFHTKSPTGRVSSTRCTLARWTG